MRSGHLAASLLVPVLGLSACVTTTTTSTTWGDPYTQGWARNGRVESIRETVHRQQGDPAAGAVAGAVVGGLLGSAMSYHHPVGGIAGAVGGAMVGAAASQGSAESRVYEVFVRFEDGGLEPFAFQGALPFQVGDLVSHTPRGLFRL
jgi:outer membrane lipoprotein SlyB